MTAMLNHKNIVSSPITNGDAGIILKENGSFEIFTSGDLKNGTLTNEQQVQATKLMALSAALSIPSVMDTLITLSEDKEVFGGLDLSNAYQS
jgi:hypothetical protein